MHRFRHPVWMCICLIVYQTQLVFVWIIGFRDIAVCTVYLAGGTTFCAVSILAWHAHIETCDCVLERSSRANCTLLVSVVKESFVTQTLFTRCTAAMRHWVQVTEITAASPFIELTFCASQVRDDQFFCANCWEIAHTNPFQKAIGQAAARGQYSTSHVVNVPRQWWQDIATVCFLRIKQHHT